ncbi:Wzz/FepE/Etk N-terminal domain-containing protein [Pedobacter sp. P26]|uniref:Wzz/FepE/Etk N-terminal domain-containing protein n=1 Tax=Pedobacter sp. P26 TaxID=3423956 RepID=UPI003D674555
MKSETLYQKPDTNNNEVSFNDLLITIKGWYRYLRSKWLIIFVLGLIGGMLGYAYAYFTKPIYVATSTFVLEEGDKAGSLGQYSGLASMVGVDLGGGGGLFQGDNIIELYKSRTMIEKTLLTPIFYNNKSQLLIDRYIEINKLKKQWAKNPELVSLNFGKTEPSRLKDSIIGKVVLDIRKKYLTVAKPDKALSIIKVEVKGKDEIFSKEFNDQMVKNVNDFYVLTKTKKSMENLSILQHQTDSVRNILNGAIYSAAQVNDATPNLNPTRQILRAPALRSQFNAEANKTILAQLIQQLELAKLSLRKETPLIQVVDQPVYPLEKEFLGKIKGAVLGCMVFCLLACIVLLIRMASSSNINSNNYGRTHI